MTVVFDAEPLLAFSFDEPGADVVEDWLDRVYAGDADGYVTTMNLAEFRYVAVRRTSAAAADGHIRRLQEMGLTVYGIDDLWEVASTVKAEHSPAIGDAYALAAADELAPNDDVTLLVGGDEDYDRPLRTERFGDLIERFRHEGV